MRNLIFPEQFVDTKDRRGRGAKPFTIIALPEKKKDLQYFHCPRHKGLRLLPIEGRGYICTFCGPTLPATKTVDVEQQ